MAPNFGLLSANYGVWVAYNFELLGFPGCEKKKRHRFGALSGSSNLVMVCLFFLEGDEKDNVP